MERWCVTREDLQQFKRLVRNAVHEGRIGPTDMDPFDPEDDVIGPCVHTVNAQFIVPVTSSAGGASWALMKHPEGLPCDLFVTHGWAEGIYEFIDKVLYCWPRNVHHAYCCMLSNPQNLDISELCATPGESPFAKALSHASHMLVVPNRTGSIYTRVWCAYEAFLCYSQRKQISTASSVPHDFWLKTLQATFAFVAAAGAGIAVSVVLGRAGWGGAKTVNVYAALVFDLSVIPFLFGRDQQRSKLLTVAKFSIVAHAAIYLATSVLRPPLGQPGSVASLVLVCTGLFWVPWVVESDLAMVAQSIQERRQLLSGFTGRLRDAQCSVPADGERIRRELTESGREADVDQAVKELIFMGTFSPRLCNVVRRAGIVGNVSRFSKAIVAGNVFLWIRVPLDRYFVRRVCTTTSLAWFNWGLLLAWMLICTRLPHDCVAFAVGALMMSLPLWMVNLVGSALGDGAFCTRDWVLAVFIGPFIILLTLLGPALTARLPLVGPPLVRLLLCSRRLPRLPKDKDPQEGGRPAEDAEAPGGAAAEGVEGPREEGSRLTL